MEDDEGPECRICRDGTPPLLTGSCACTGSLAHVHAACLKRWLAVSNEALASRPRCSVCRQPIRLAAPGFGRYLVVRASRLPDALDALAAAPAHLVRHLSTPCTHSHCLLLRWVLVLGVLQLALWLGQLLLLAAFFFLSEVLYIDRALDEVLVPPILQPVLRAVMPSPAVVGDMTIGFASAPSSPTFDPLSFVSASAHLHTALSAFIVGSFTDTTGQQRASAPGGATSRARRWLRDALGGLRRAVASSGGRRAANQAEDKLRSSMLLESLGELRELGARALRDVSSQYRRCLEPSFYVPLWRADVDALTLALLVLQAALWAGPRNGYNLTQLARLLQPPLLHVGRLQLAPALSDLLNAVFSGYLARLILSSLGVLPLDSWPIRMNSPVASGLFCHALLSLGFSGVLSALGVALIALEEDFVHWRWTQVL